MKRYEPVFYAYSGRQAIASSGYVSTRTATILAPSRILFGIRNGSASVRKGYPSGRYLTDNPMTIALSSPHCECYSALFTN
jgi:hypothetical protein